MNDTTPNLEWLILQDAELSGADLAARVETQLARRQAELGRVSPQFPTFGFVADMPQPPNDRQFSPNLYHHLRQANDTPSPETDPVLASSPITRLPVLGRLWGLIRQEAHNLVLFYVNRLAARQEKSQSHVVNVLNELTRQVQAQQEEIEQLREQLAQQGKVEKDG